MIVSVLPNEVPRKFDSFKVELTISSESELARLHNALDKVSVGHELLIVLREKCKEFGIDPAGF